MNQVDTLRFEYPVRAESTETKVTMMEHTTRRRFVGTMLAATALPAVSRLVGARSSITDAEAGGYVRANTDWLAACRFGIGIHWTAQTVPRAGPATPFTQAVADFDLKGFLAAIDRSGADYVLFTIAHALQRLPAPHPVLDRILPGRTCEGDLIQELAEALAAKGKHLLLYYNHSCNGGQDPAWEQAVGYHAAKKDRLAENLMEIVSWLGNRYRKLIKAWWFDSPYSLDPRGPHNSVTTDMSGFQFPWERFTVAGKTGYSARLVTYNPGVAETYLYTTHQDYWAGELVNLESPARGRYLDNGLQWFGWTCLEDRAWVHTRLDTPIPAPLHSDEAILRYVRTCNQHRAPMTFNVGIYQEGTLAPGSVDQLSRLDRALKPVR